MTAHVVIPSEVEGSALSTLSDADARMRQVALGLALRILLGVIGGAAVIAGVIVGAYEIRSAMHGFPWTAAVLSLFCLVVICGGVILLNGAWTGRIAVRDPAGRDSHERR